MRSLEARFAHFYSRLGTTTYIAFADAVTGQHFSAETIRRWYPKLVEKDDVEGVDKKELFKHLFLVNALEGTRKRG